MIKKPSLFHSQNSPTSLEEAIKRSALVLETFQRLLKIRKMPAETNQIPQDNNVLQKTVMRYADAIESRLDVTAIECSINAAFSALNSAALKNLETRLILHHQQLISQAKRQENSGIKILEQEEAYIKTDVAPTA